MIAIKCIALEDQQPTVERDECPRTIADLNWDEYQRYKKFQMRVMNEMGKHFTEKNREEFVYIYSLSHPDSPSRKFKQNYPEWCKCPPCLGENNKCAHEIKLFNGYIQCCCEPCHFHQKGVTVSLKGWQPTKEKSIDELIGHGDDIHSESDIIDFGNADNSEDVVEASIEDGKYVVEAEIDNDLANATTDLPIHLPVITTQQNFLAPKHLGRFFDSTEKGYSNYSDEKKVRIRWLVLQLEQEIIWKEDTIVNSSGISLHAPSATDQVNEPKKRLTKTGECQEKRLGQYTTIPYAKQQLRFKMMGLI